MIARPWSIRPTAVPVARRSNATPGIQAGTALAVIEIEPERSYQVQRAAGIGAKAYDMPVLGGISG
jgi:hypothetical protein